MIYHDRRLANIEHIEGGWLIRSMIFFAEKR